MKFKLINIEENLSRFVMVAIGVLCVGLSIWYTSSFFIRDSELPVIIAVSLSTAIAIFNSFALAAATFLVHHKKWIMAVIFIPIWLATTAFDIFTVAGSQSYRFQLSNQETAQVQEQQDRTDLSFQLLQTDYDNAMEDQRRLTEEIRSADTTIRGYETELQNLTQRRSALEDVTLPEYAALTRQMNTTDAYLRQTRTNRTTRQTELEEARRIATEARESMQTNIAETETKEIEQISSMEIKVSFANWIHQIFPAIKIQYIQFILAIIPAFFIDLISPIAMSFGLTLAKDANIEKPFIPYKKEEEVKEEKSTEIVYGKLPLVLNDPPVVIQKETVEPPEIPVVGQLNTTFNKPVKLEFEPVNNIEDTFNKPIELGIKPTGFGHIGSEEIEKAIQKGVMEKVYEEEKPIEKPKRKRRTKKEIEEAKKDIVVYPIEVPQTLKEEVIERPMKPPSPPIPQTVVFSNGETKTYPQPIVDKKPEQPKSPFVKPQDVQETNILTSPQEKTIHYKFGKTTENIMNKLIEFINLCIRDEGPFSLHPDSAASSMNLSGRAKQVFINRLLSIRLGAKTLVTKNKYGEYYANYSGPQIIKYVSEIVND